MIHLAHLINPVKTVVNTELTQVQPITFETLRRARENCGTNIKIDLLTAQFAEDHDIIPDYFTKTRDLQRSVIDVGSFETPLKLPLLKDLLDRAYHSSQATHLIFTNVDIAVQPDFYDKIIKRIESGLDAFIINRRRIPAHFKSINELPAMYAHRGLSHPGFDCFVFHRDLYPRFQLERVCVGIPFVGITLAQNLFCHSENFRLFDKDFMTFHIGEEIFKKRELEYYRFNRNQFWRAMAKLWPDMHISRFPWAHLPLISRMLKYGFHPSIPIRLVLMLELRNRGWSRLNTYISPLKDADWKEL